MSKISINEEGLRQNANAIKRRQEQLQRLNAELESLIGVIEAGWKGEAGTAYVALMTRYHQQGKKMEQVLQEFVSYAENAAKRFEEADRNAAAQIRSSW